MPLEGAGRIHADVLERLGECSSFEEACSVVLGLVLEEGGDARAILVGRAGRMVRAGGWRVGPSVMREARADAEDEASTLAAYFARPGTARPDRASAPRYGDFCAHLIMSFRESGGACEVLLLAEPPAAPEQERILAEVTSRSSGVLLHLLELDRLRAERERLSAEQELQATMLRAISDPVLLTDSDANIVFANPRARELFSSRDNDAEGRVRAIRLNTALFSTRLAAAGIPGSGSTGADLNLVDPADGSDLLFEMRTAPVSGGVQSNPYRVSVLRDITDLKRAAEELVMEFRRSKIAAHRAREEGERLRAILANVAKPILVTNPEGDIVLMNLEAQRLFEPAGDGSEGDARRSSWTNATRFTSFVHDLLLRPERGLRERLTLVDPGGTGSFPVEARAVRIDDAQGQTVSVVTVIRDLTQEVENHRLAQELQAFNRELESRVEDATLELEERNRVLQWQREELRKASKLKSQFLASMSHELRTPINAVLGYTSLLQEAIYGPLSSEQLGVLEKVDSASEHLLALVNDVLDLSKIEAGKTAFQVEELDFNELLPGMQLTLDPRLRDSPVELRWEIDPGLPMLRADRTKLRQIIFNLVDNGLKHTDEGSVEVRVRRSADDRMEIRVEDTGEGIAGEELEQIFEAFTQVDTRGTRGGGAGLGLTITRKLVSLMGGSITVDSELGEGTTFTIDLPLHMTTPVLSDQEDPAVVLPSRREGLPRTDSA